MVVITDPALNVTPASLAGRERDTLCLTWEERRWTRKRVVTSAGREVGLALPTGSVLRPGDIVAVEAGWWEALSLRCDAPIVTIAVVMEPVPIRVARAQARRRLTGDLADVQTRAKHQMIETSEDRARRYQGEREEQELAEGHSPWRYEAFVSAAVPAGAVEQRRLVREQVESACVQAGLVPAFMYGLQLDHFLCTLPVCRGIS